MRGSIAVALGVFVAIAVGVSLFFTTCEKRTRTVYTGLQGEAVRNRYLAAQRLLEAMGAEVRAAERVEALDALPPATGTVLLPLNRSGFAPKRSRELLQWVSAGGHLVVVTWSLWDDPARPADDILDPLGVHQFMWEAAEPEDDEVVTEPVPDLAEVTLEDRDEPLHAEFDPWFYLRVDEQDPAEVVWEVGDESGTHVLTIREGDGYVTAMTDDYIVANPTIGNLDHAELLWRLVNRFDRSGEILLIYDAEYPSAWLLAWRHGWMVVASLAALIGLWLWHAVPRFGPLVPDESGERRRLMEHIDAAGRFQLRSGAEAALADSVREALRVRLQERHPAWLALAPAELHKKLAEQSGIPRERIDRALAYRTAPAERDRERFAVRIATLERIRKAL